MDDQSITDGIYKGASEWWHRPRLTTAPWLTAQDFGSMAFAGHEREYYVSAPPGDAPPTGLIVALTPGDITGAMWFCR